jgi:threonine/homoserine/homoserine lactone efflux protein
VLRLPRRAARPAPGRLERARPARPPQHRPCRSTHAPLKLIEANWLLFLLASVVVIATQGQDMILVMSRSLSYGTRAGVITAAGASVGLLGHTLLATLGLGALLRTSEWLFSALKFIGAAYLAWLGLQLLRTRSAQLAAASSAPHSPWRLFLTGALSNISNPKIAVFFFAFLPQFIHRPGRSVPRAGDLRAGHPVRGAHLPDQGAGGAVLGPPVVMVPGAAAGAGMVVRLQRAGDAGAGHASGPVAPRGLSCAAAGLKALLRSPGLERRLGPSGRLATSRAHG